MAKDIFWGMSEETIRQRVVAEARKLLGVKEGSIEHKKLVDTYNAMPKLPRGYQLRYDDAWCAATMSYIGIVLGISRVILSECSCAKMIELYRTAGRWEERDDYVPGLADIVMYDWEAKKGECTGAPDHTGMVVGKEGKTLQVLEGNYGNRVKLREIPLEYVKVRGYCRPDYAGLVHGFSDVPADAWYREAVQWADGEGIAEGVGKMHFAPGAVCTRAHAVTMLWRLCGSPAAENGCPFGDVPADAWYQEAVTWAAGKGITAGIAVETFAPDAPCTRGQIATMLWRAAGTPQAECAAHSFTDVPADAWYSDAVEWCWCEGIAVGCSGTEFMPAKACTRAELVEMLWLMSRVR